MNRALALALLLLFVGGACAVGPPLAKQAILPLAHPASGHVLDGRLYAMRVYKQSVFSPPGQLPEDHSPPDLVDTPIGPKGPVRWENRRLGGYVEVDTWCRWRVGQNCVWWTGHRAGVNCGVSRIILDILRNEKDPDTRALMLWGVGFFAEPVGDVAAFNLFTPEWRREVLAAPWDALPGSTHALLFFCWRGELLVWRGKFRPGKYGPESPEKWEGADGTPRKGVKHPPLFAVKTDLKEQFLAHTDGKDFFLVTASGAVHRLAQRGKEWKLELSWRGAARPVRLLVTDGATGTTYAFAHRAGPPTDQLPDIYFPLAGKLTPVAYKRDEASPAKASGSEAALLAAARLLIKKGEIKEKR